MRLHPRTATRAPLRRRAAALLVSSLACVLVLSGCSVYDAPLPGGADTGDNPMTIKVMFRDVLDLVPQSTVKVDDVTVGKVTAIDLKGYVAEVTVEVPGDIDLPDNARAQIRQTSLLGEKFVELGPPQEPGSGKLSDNDVIGLDRTGRNPEVEEVFGALSLLLNGGGVGQLKTIVSELNNTFDGREDEIRSVLTQIRDFMGQLDDNKASVVAAIENTNRLAVEIKKQDGAIKSALDDVPDALRSVDRQRADLVKLLKALDRLSGVGVRVIQASKEATINTLRDLGPVLESFAKAGQDLPKAFQVFLTYPFVDEAVGRDPQVARNLHMGDYTNLSINLDLNVASLPKLPIGAACEALGEVLTTTRQNVGKAADALVNGLPDNPLITKKERQRLRNALVNRLLKDALDEARKQCEAPDVAGLTKSGQKLVKNLLDVLNILTPKQIRQLLNGTLGPLGGALSGLTSGLTGGNTTGGGGGGGGGGGNGGGNLGDSLGLPRVEPGADFRTPDPIDPFDLARHGFDPGIGTMLLQGVADVR